MQILRAFAVSEDALIDGFLPEVEACRPDSCPGCGQAARPPGRRLGIVGHGAYARSVRLLTPGVGQVRIAVRRFKCRGCQGTIGLLPDLLHPRRWWSAVAILWVLSRHLITGWTVRTISEHLELSVGETPWRTVRRWRRQLLERLWPGWGRMLGCRDPAPDREEGRRRLLRLLAQAGWEPGREPEAELARALVAGVT